MDPRMREEAYQLAQYAEKYQTLNLLETPLIPEPLNRGPSFDERLREAIDVDRMIDESNAELADYANKRIPLPPKDLTQKDLTLLQQVNLVA